MRRRSLIQGVLGSIGLMMTAFPIQAEELQDPYDWVVSVSNGVLDAIRADARLQQGNQDALQELVDKHIMPNVDFPMITRMTVGPRWRQATKEERLRLQNGFEKLLMRVYSGALKTVKDNVCELRPTRNRRVSDELVVRTLLKSTGAPDIALDYRIYRNKQQNAWKIVDV
ncbi:Toluene tolerance, partial [gut metagenome]